MTTITPALEAEIRAAHANAKTRSAGRFTALACEHIIPALDALRAAEADAREQHLALGRVWHVLGRPSYESLVGKDISEVVAALRDRAESAERRTAELEGLLREARTEITLSADREDLMLDQTAELIVRIDAALAETEPSDA